MRVGDMRRGLAPAEGTGRATSAEFAVTGTTSTQSWLLSLVITRGAVDLGYHSSVSHS